MHAHRNARLLAVLNLQELLQPFLKRLQKLLIQLNPKIAEVRVETLIDNSFMNRLESSGFIQSLYKKN